MRFVSAEPPSPPDTPQRAHNHNELLTVPTLLPFQVLTSQLLVVFPPLAPLIGAGYSLDPPTAANEYATFIQVFSHNTLNLWLFSHDHDKFRLALALSNHFVSFSSHLPSLPLVVSSPPTESAILRSNIDGLSHGFSTPTCFVSTLIFSQVRDPAIFHQDRASGGLGPSMLQPVSAGNTSLFFTRPGSPPLLLQVTETDLAEARPH